MADLRSKFLLNPDITYLNFGSFGACPKPVFEAYQRYQLELEKEPVHFITVEGMERLTQSRQALGAYLHCHPDDVVYVTNPSYAVNTIARSLDLQEGDEILTTDLEYGACDKAWSYLCNKTGAIYNRISLSLPVSDKEQWVEAIRQGISPRTKLIFISHITSTTALRLPVEEVCALAREHGILSFVDGAHAPGQLTLDLTALKADMYTGACHKWMMTPKGSSFLYVRRELQSAIDPLVVSWGYKAMFPSHSTFLDSHQMNGTRDYSAFLTIPDALAFMQEHHWDEVARQCRQLVYANAERLCDLLRTQPLAPLQDDFILQMFSARIQTSQPEALHDLLWQRYRIQIPVMRHGPDVYLRYSINAFNDQRDLDRLFDAIQDIKRNTGLIG